MVRKLLVIMLLLIGLLFDISHAGTKCSVKDYIPEKAKELLPTIYKEVNRIIGEDFKYPYYFPALIEHESCVVLCGKGYWAKRCWSPKSRLKTKREEGAGFFQLTRTFTRTGRVKWDIISYLKKLYPKELSELNWNNVYDRPDLQIKAGLLLWKRNFERFSKNIPLDTRLAFSDSVYNGGFRWFNKERSLCKMKKGCDPNRWFGHVEKIKSKRAIRKLYGDRTAWDINRHHVRDVIKVRLPKYEKDYEENFKKEKVKTLQEILEELLEEDNWDY